jgi:hypothetical protein
VATGGTAMGCLMLYGVGWTQRWGVSEASVPLIADEISRGGRNQHRPPAGPRSRHRRPDAPGRGMATRGCGSHLRGAKQQHRT